MILINDFFKTTHNGIEYLFESLKTKDGLFTVQSKRSFLSENRDRLRPRGIYNSKKVATEICMNSLLNLIGDYKTNAEELVSKIEKCNSFADYVVIDQQNLKWIYFIKQKNGTVVINGDGETFLENVFIDENTPEADLEVYAKSGAGNRELLKKYGKTDYMHEMINSECFKMADEALLKDMEGYAYHKTMEKYKSNQAK